LQFRLGGEPMGKGNRRIIRSLNLVLSTIALSVLLCDIASAFARTSLQPFSAKVARAFGPSDDGISQLPTSDYAVFIDSFGPPGSSVSAQSGYLLTGENVTVRQTDAGGDYLLAVSFAIPDVPDVKFDTIMINGLQIVGKQKSHDRVYPAIRGSWQPREHVEFSVRVPKENSDPSLGWNLIFCVGSAALCYPSPNLLTLVPQNQQTSDRASPPATTVAAPADFKSLRPQGIAAYRQGDYAGALRIFREVIAADSNDIVAYNVAANCSLRLKDYPSAIDYFKHALRLQPDEYHNVSGLIRAYTLAGMAPKRDELRQHIAELEDAGKLPETFNYVFETFDVGDKKIEVAEFPKIQGFYGERYRFMVFNDGGKETYCITLESDSLEQPRWAQEHPKEAAAGGRKFSLDGYGSDSHSTFGFYDGEPPYEQVREEAKQILTGKKQAVSKTAYSNPQPIPGAE